METKLPPSVSMENYSDTDRLGQLPNLNVIASDLYQFNAIIKKKKKTIWTKINAKSWHIQLC